MTRGWSEELPKSLGPMPVPLGEGLQDPVGEEAAARMWNQILALRTPKRRAGGYRWPLALTLTASLAVAIAFFWGGDDPGSLLLEDGTSVTAVVVPPGAPSRTLDFTDGSRVTVHGGGALKRLGVTPTNVSLQFLSGSAEFSVRPGGPRRWTVETGLGSVEVVGTVFSLERTPEALAVTVARGAVVVRSSFLSDGARRLEAGERVRIVARPEPETFSRRPELPVRKPAPPSDAGVQPTTDPPPAGSRLPEHRAPRDADLAAQLFEASDQARLRGDNAGARRPLERLLTHLPNSPKRFLAMFSLGSIALDAGDPKSAARWYRRAIDDGAPQSLSEDCYLRLTEALLRAGRATERKRAAVEYLKVFPRGRHRASMRAIANAR